MDNYNSNNIIEESIIWELFPRDPYEVQRKFVHSLVKLLSERPNDGKRARIGIFESPTGTGKTASLLCGSLGWLMSNAKESVATNKENVENKDKEVLVDLPRSLNEEPLRKIDDGGKVEQAMKRRRLGLSYLSEEISVLLDRIDNDLGDKPSASHRMRRLYYASRTHSQLMQVMAELRKILKKVSPVDSSRNIRAVSLASRQTLCINETVRKLNSVERINERCQELLQHQQCPYYNDGEVSGSFLSALSSVADIEELVQKGKNHCQCPYYGSRALVHPHLTEESQRQPTDNSLDDITIITLPYHLLLHPPARESLDLELAESVIIFDEAHNLVDFVNDLRSTTLSGRALKSLQDAMRRYVDRVGGRMAPARLVKLNQLLHTLGKLQLSTNSNQGLPNEGVMDVNEFLVSQEIDHINFLPILDYCRESNLAPKLSSYVDKAQEEADTGEVVVQTAYLLFDFLASLIESNSDGRIIISRDEGNGVRLRYVALNPATTMAFLVECAHAVILAGGTMSPAEDIVLQLFPSPLTVQTHSFSHLIGMENCCGIVMGSGPTGRPLRFTHQAYQADTAISKAKEEESSSLMSELAQTLVNICRIVPQGMVVFFASYRLLDYFLASVDLFSGRFRKSIHVERPSLDLATFLDNYAHDCYQGDGAMLLAVMGGRLSEGVNFGDGLARAVVLVGLPYPNFRNQETRLRAEHYRKHYSSKNIKEPENEGGRYMEGICLRTINQTLGRAIRHSEDWSSIILVDDRYGQERIQNQLSTWFRPCLLNGLVHGETNSTNFAQTFSHLVQFYRRKKLLLDAKH